MPVLHALDDEIVRVNESLPDRAANKRTVVLADGTVVVLWSTADPGGLGPVYAQRYAADGDALGGVTRVDPLLGDQGLYDVAALDDGGYAVVMIDRSRLFAPNTARAVIMSLFDADGAARGEPILVTSPSTVDARLPQIETLDNGILAVTWEDDNSTSWRQQLFDADGDRIGAERSLPLTGLSRGTAATAVSPDGYSASVILASRFVSDVEDNAYYLSLHVFNDVGQFNGSATITLEVFDAGYYRNPAIARLDDGRYAVIFERGGSSILEYVILATTGFPLTAQALLHSNDGTTRVESDVIAIAGGGFIVTWTEAGGGDTQLRARVFDASLTPGDIVTLSPPSEAHAMAEAIRLPDGDLQITWIRRAELTGFGPDVVFSRFGLFEQQLGDASANVLIGTAGRDELSGGGGSDVLYGGAAGDYLTASTVSDAVAVDELYGDEGDDQLFGAAGADLLAGGDGDDVIEASGFAGADAGDEVDGGDGIDTVSYRLAVAFVSVDLFDPSENEGEAANDSFSAIENATGSAFGDSLSGDTGNNALKGGEGDDVLMGRGGADVLIGGDGVDRASYSGAATAVIVDMTTPSAQSGDAAGDVFVGIETVVGSAFGDTLRGAAGSELLDGSGGDDTLEGRGGGDVMNGGAGNDTASYRNAASGVRADLSGGVSGTGDAAGDAFGVENLLGSAFADDLRGDGLANRLTGGAGGDVLRGAAGADRLEGEDGGDTLFGDADADRLEGGAGGDNLNGGAGNDVLLGGAGSDRIDGGAGLDLIDLRTLTAAVQITLGGAATSTLFVGGVAEDYVRNVEQVYGGAGADILNGDALANVLYGFTGADLLRGGGGADSLDGFDGSDTADYRDKGQSVSVTLNGATNASVRVNGVSEDAVRNVENVRGGGAADTLIGDGLFNQLFGEGGADRLTGAGNRDVLSGGAGADVFVYLALSDSTVASGGRDAISDFVSGTDDIDLSAIDANSGVAGDQAFVLGALAAGQAGRLAVSANGAGSWLVQGDVTGDGAADFAIVVNGAVAPVAGDFVL